MKITYGQLFDIQKGIQMCNGIKSFELGIQKGRLSQVINPEIELMRDALKNQEWYEINEKLKELKTESEKQAFKNSDEFVKLRDEYTQQIKDYNEYVSKPYEKNNLPTIDASLFPADTDSEIADLLLPVLNFGDAPTKKPKK